MTKRTLGVQCPALLKTVVHTTCTCDLPSRPQPSQHLPHLSHGDSPDPQCPKFPGTLLTTGIRGSHMAVVGQGPGRPHPRAASPHTGPSGRRHTGSSRHTQYVPQQLRRERVPFDSRSTECITACEEGGHLVHSLPADSGRKGRPDYRSPTP